MTTKSIIPENIQSLFDRSDQAISTGNHHETA